MSDSQLSGENDRPRNSRRGLLIIACGTVVMCLGLLVHNVTSPSPDELLESAVENRFVDPEAALRDIDRLLKEGDGPVQTARVLKCQLLITLGRVPHAVSELTAIRDLSDVDVPVVLECVDEWTRAGALQPAHQTLLLALKPDAPQPEVAKRLIEIAYELGDQKSVLEHCQLYASVAPNDPMPWLVSAGIHHLNEEAVEALKAYGQALQRNLPVEEARRVRYQSAVLLLYIGNLAQARTHLESLADDPAISIDVALLTAELLHREGRLHEALDVVNRLLADHPEVTPAHLRRGLIHFDQADYESAVADLTHFTRAVPNQRRAHYTLGQALLRLGRPDEARQNLAISRRLVEEEADSIREGNP